MPRSPLGVVTRNPAEWNLNNMFMLWESVSGPGPGFISCGAVLYNSLQNGNIILWDFEITCHLNPNAATSKIPTRVSVSRGHGIPDSTVAGPDSAGCCLGNNADIPLGSTYVVAGGSLPSQYTQQIVVGGMLGYNVGGAFRWGKPFPVVQLQPGDGFFVYVTSETSTIGNGTATQTSVNFTFEAGSGATYP